MKDIFEGIQSFFEDFALAPLDYLRNLELDNWFLANLMNWIFMLIGIVAFAYWLKQLKKAKDNNEENTDSTSHSFLS